jgi:hypothetical protein
LFIDLPGVASVPRKGKAAAAEGASHKKRTSTCLRDGKLPIHLAVAAGGWSRPPNDPMDTCREHSVTMRCRMTSFRSADVIKWLIDASPTSLLEKDEGGNTPLHIAGPTRFGGRGHDACRRLSPGPV